VNVNGAKARNPTRKTGQRPVKASLYAQAFKEEVAKEAQGEI